MQREYEHLDILEMERLVASALIELIDDPHEQHQVTLSALARRSGLPKRRVREMTDSWELSMLSGDEYMLTPALVDRVRELLSNPRHHA